MRDRTKLLKPAIREQEERIQASKAKGQEYKYTAPASAIALKLEDCCGKWVGQCPACEKLGGDKKAEHLVVYESGAWTCIARGDDPEHRREMIKLAPVLVGGQMRKLTPQEILERKQKKEREEAQKTANKMIADGIFAQLCGEISDLGESEEIPDVDEMPVWHFKKHFDCFVKGDFFWIGGLKDTPGEMFLEGFFQKGKLTFVDAFNKLNFLKSDLGILMSMRENSESRDKINFIQARRIVVECDKLTEDGKPIKDENDKDIPMPKNMQIAVIRYCKEILGWDLDYVIDTRGKSYHAIFKIPQNPEIAKNLPSDFKTLISLGVDPAALSGSKTRVPGLVRQGKHLRQRVIWSNPKKSEKNS